MRVLLRKLLLFSIFFLFLVKAQAQEKNVLAKVAYENAEAALASGNTQEAIAELNTVDGLLGKLTPKSQYLRVQIWSVAAEKNFSLIDSALTACQSYLALSKQHEVAEEKIMEVTRWLVKLEKEKAANAKSLAIKTIVARVVDSLYAAFNVKLGATEEEFRKQNPDAFKGMKKKITAGDILFEPKQIKGYAGMSFNKNNRLFFYQYHIISDESSVVKRLFQSLVDKFPADMSKEYSSKIINNDPNSGLDNFTVQGRAINENWKLGEPGNWQIRIYSFSSGGRASMFIAFQTL